MFSKEEKKQAKELLNRFLDNHEGLIMTSEGVVFIVGNKEECINSLAYALWLLKNKSSDYFNSVMDEFMKLEEEHENKTSN